MFSKKKVYYRINDNKRDDTFICLDDISLLSKGPKDITLQLNSTTWTFEYEDQDKLELDYANIRGLMSGDFYE